MFKHEGHDSLPAVLKNVNDRFLVTNGQVNDLPGKAGSVIELTDKIFRYGWNYIVMKASNEVTKFSDKREYESSSVEIDGILYFPVEFYLNKIFWVTLNCVKLHWTCAKLCIAYR